MARVGEASRICACDTHQRTSICLERSWHSTKKNVNVNLESSPPSPLTISLYARPVTVTHLAD